jgi:hypothetical protein
MMMMMMMKRIGEAVERDFKAKVLRASAAAKGGSKCRELTTTSPHDSVRAVQSIAKRACLHNGIVGDPPSRGQP